MASLPGQDIACACAVGEAKVPIQRLRGSRNASISLLPRTLARVQAAREIWAPGGEVGVEQSERQRAGGEGRALAVGSQPAAARRAEPGAERDPRPLPGRRVGSARGSRDCSPSPRGGASLRDSGRVLPGAASARPASAQLGWSWGPVRLSPTADQRRAPRSHLWSGTPSPLLSAPAMAKVGNCGGAPNAPRFSRLRLRLLGGPAVPGPDTGDLLTSTCEDRLLLLPALSRAPPARSAAGGEQLWSRSSSTPGGFGQPKPRTPEQE